MIISLIASYTVFILFFYSFAKIFLYFFRQRWHFPKATNYRNEAIDTGYGIVFAANSSLVVLFISLLPFYHPFVEMPEKIDVLLGLLYFLFFLFVSCPIIISLVGYYDDARGQKNVKGLGKNFILSLRGRKPTSSIIKAMTTFSVALLYSVGYQIMSGQLLKESLIVVALNISLICLFTNFFNLLDLRPGRAIKIYFFLSLLTLFVVLLNEKTASSFLVVYQSFPVLAAVLAYAPLDFRGQAMMGDAGSNMLGFVLGIGYAVILPLPAKVAVVIFLTLFHIYCEFYSFSDFISRNKVLRYLDEFGTCMRKDSKQENKAGSDTGDV